MFVLQLILLFLDFSSVTTCNVTKTVCYNCDQSGPTECTSDSVSTTQKGCYDGVDGCTYFMSEYQKDSSTCLYRRCHYTLFSDGVNSNRVVTMMTCSSGILQLCYLHIPFIEMSTRCSRCSNSPICLNN